MGRQIIRASYAAQAPTEVSRARLAEISGSSSEIEDMPSRWLNFVSQNLYSYQLVGDVSEDFRIAARSRNLDGFTLARFFTVGGASQLNRTTDHIRLDGQNRVGLYLSLGGRLELAQFGRSQDYGPGSLALLSACDPAVHTKLGGNDTLCFMIPRQFVDQRVLYVEEICARPSLADDPMGKLVRDTLTSFHESAHLMDDEQFRSTARLVGDLVLLALAGAADVVTGVRSVRGGNLARAKRVIRSRLDDLDLSVAAIAAECGVSVSYLHNLFRDDGRTVWEYLKGERLRRARQMLECRSGTPMTVTEVSLACGYSNMSQFSTAFKRAFGVSPREVLYRG
jgi:AraC-like DNA-binding protein